MSILQLAEVSTRRGETLTAERLRSALLQRRLLLALHDLGIDKVLPSCWVQPTNRGLAFADLTLTEADRLVLALEALSERLVVEVHEPGPGQLRLFAPDA